MSFIRSSANPRFLFFAPLHSLPRLEHLTLGTCQSSILRAVHTLLHNDRKLIMQIGSVNKNRRRQSISMRIRVTFTLAVNC
jgi:hypothetical protein